MRACSPPESRPTGSSSCSGRKRKRLAHEATWTLRPWKTHRVALRREGAAERLRRDRGSRRSCSKRTSRSPSARSISPASGARVPASRLSSVVLPLPFGPMRPTCVPRTMVRSRSRTSGRPPSALDSPRATRSLRRPPRRGGEARCRRCRRRRAPRASSSSSIRRPASRMRPLALVERAFAPAPEPLDLAPHRVGERLLVGGLAAQELVAAGEELAVPPVGLEESAPGRRG